MRIEITVTDLWGDGEGGWSANGCWVNRTEIEVPDNLSDTAIVRRIKKAAGIEGMRRDYWAGEEWCWRDGCIGAYAEVIS